jgi:hypothetical protein
MVDINWMNVLDSGATGTTILSQISGNAIGAPKIDCVEQIGFHLLLPREQLL